MSESRRNITGSDIIHDVIIVGAGPCGLAVAARLCEPTPSAVFTDDEHARYHWLNKHGNRMSLKNRKDGRIRPASGSGDAHSILVLDSSSDQWMGNWNRLFKTFEISHLRSPMFFHVDPADRDSLLAHTHECNSQGELQEICNCVGKEVSKHKRKMSTRRKTKGASAELIVDERDRKDYYTPTTGLFTGHCDKIVDRYGLGAGMIRKETVENIDFGMVDIESTPDNIFTVQTELETYYARTVVLAIGAGMKPVVPPQVHLCMSKAIGHIADEQLEGACHSMQIRQFPDPSVRKKIKIGRHTTILVVGGGLTSAQISDLALRRGVSKVWHVMRSGFKVKPFDVDLEWMAKFRNTEKASFWSEDSDASRFDAIQKARGGGSINPPYAKTLRTHVSRGKVALVEHTTVTPDRFDAASQTWRVKPDPPNAELEAVKFDYIYFATGVQADFQKVPCLQNMLAKFPIHGHGGLPCLGEDLEWWGQSAETNSVMKRGESADWKQSNHEGQSTRVPLFVTGRLAGLRLGPGAGNLEGARIGAERVALGIQEHLSGLKSKTGMQDSGDQASHLYRYAAGIGSRYDSLDLQFEDLFDHS